VRSLFLKTFLWFWLTVFVTIAAMTLSVFLTQSRIGIDAALLSSAARDAVMTYESSGEWALSQELGRLRREQTAEGFLLRDGADVLGQRGPSGRDVEDIARLAAGEKDGRRFRGSLAAQTIRSDTSGRTYVFVLANRDTYHARTVLLIQIPLILLAGGGIFCWVIARHVTAPLFRLRSAASSIAEGRLDTRVGGVLGQRRDEIAGLALDFDRMAGRIESLLTGQKNLLGDVSHELRSPLARLNVALSLARSAGREELPEHLDRIQLEARRLDTLISQLLTLSRIDSGVHAGERAPINLGNLVQEVASEADFEARASGRRVTLDCAETCTIAGSEEVIRSAVENVLRNAVRYTGEGTAVEVALRREESRAVLRIRDHGAGVPAALLPEIFLPFRRAEITTNGAGLGLAITERAVKAHGGSVIAENSPHGGLVVRMEFPAA
jgi:two-component system sensor histidine kinase CpxA